MAAIASMEIAAANSKKFIGAESSIQEAARVDSIAPSGNIILFLWSPKTVGSVFRLRSNEVASRSAGKPILPF